MEDEIAQDVEHLHPNFHNKECRDCVHFKGSCKEIIGFKGRETECYWNPPRFEEKEMKRKKRR